MNGGSRFQLFGSSPSGPRGRSPSNPLVGPEEGDSVLKINRLLATGAVLAVLLISSSFGAQGETPAFPNAAGFGTDTRAGRGGKIMRVTSLDAEGPGSLRAALQAAGPRIVVFEVGGIIDLKKKSLVISQPFLTLAGQTAPAPGITVIRGGIYIRTHDVLIQHLRVRPGDAGQPRRSGWAPDGISASGGDAYKIVIDHCSVSWAVDENLSASGPRGGGPEALRPRRITVSNCIVAEALDNASHKKGSHSMGYLVHDWSREIAVIGNLFTHNARRNPYFKAHTTGVIVNNVIYNPRSAAIDLGYPDSEWSEDEFKPRNPRVSIVGNVLIHGRDTTSGLHARDAKLALVDSTFSEGDAYLEDNLAFGKDGKPVPTFTARINRLEDRPVWPQGLKPRPSGDVVEEVMQNAGARPRDRDATDKRIIRQLQDREGRIIDSQNDVGGYPESRIARRKLDVPEGDVESWLGEFTVEAEGTVRQERISRP